MAHHVLLIGIDTYQGGTSLRGCVHDIDAIQRVLVDRVGVPESNIVRLASPRFGAPHEADVPETLPTLARLRAALADLGTDRVAPGDQVLVYYSGHGTQRVVQHGERRVYREALLPRDVRTATSWQQLYDWELHAAIAAMLARTPWVSVVLDCCSAGGATRSLPGEPTEGVRSLSIPEVDRQALPPPRPRGTRGLAAGIGALRGTCLVVAACRADQRARETVDDGGQPHGELTRALLAQLEALDDAVLSHLTWSDIFRRVQTAVRVRSPTQTPWLWGPPSRRVFAPGEAEPFDAGYRLVDGVDGVEVDAGTLAGVTPGARIAAYGTHTRTFPPLASAADAAARLGILRVTRSQPGDSLAAPEAPFELPPDARGRLIEPGADARLRVAVEPPDDRVTAALTDPARPVAVDLDAADPELVLVPLPDGHVALTDEHHGPDPTSPRPPLATVRADEPALLRALVEHYARWRRPLRMARACVDLQGALSLSLLDCTQLPRPVPPELADHPPAPEVEAGDLARYRVTPATPICVLVHNRADVTLTVTLLGCTAGGSVQRYGNERVNGHSHKVFWAPGHPGMPFGALLPWEIDADPPRRRPVGLDQLVVIGSTAADRSLAHLELDTTFAQTIQALRSGGRPSRRGLIAAPPPERWAADVVSLRIVSTS